MEHDFHDTANNPESGAGRSGEAGKLFRQALAQGLIREEDTLLIFHDLDRLESRIRGLVQAFPEGSLHAVAVKANPLLRVLERVQATDPATGAEAASVGEVTLALKAGFTPDRIVFDSPVKTREDLLFAISKGIHVNIDNLDELARIATLTGWGDPDGVGGPRQGGGTPTGWGSFGLRVNPQVGTGSIAGSSVAGTWSKFGVPIGHRRRELEDAFMRFPWLTGVHLHVGSQGCPVDMLVRGVGILYDFVMEMNPRRTAAGLPPISLFDIGGGLPISYRADASPPSMEAYAHALKSRAPALFRPGTFRLITEFGRWAFTNSGWTVSRVEYVKRDPGINTAMIHCGADLFVRECLNPSDWQHEYSLLDPAGFSRSGTDEATYTLAGPLCFSGDILARNVPLPRVNEGDYLVIHDTGGYTFSMWSRYNSRQTPRILGWQNSRFTLLKERETLNDLQQFWE